jgi:hypothetical protein
MRVRYFVAILCAAHAAFGQAQNCGDTGCMPDLGFPEPSWGNYTKGDPTSPAITIRPDTQVWGTLEPFDTSGTLCKWAAGGPRGTCKTDVSWLHASVGLRKSLFEDAIANYILRFHLRGACYRSTQVRTQCPVCVVDWP